MLSICEYFGTKEADNMIRDDLDGFVTEVRVIDAKVRVEPLDFVRDKFPRDEPLGWKERSIRVS
jgi:hypothetical protein